ncbi:MAG: hypothetical protein JW741_27835 [Sedimentisphaerales bacterium]|nr:hypothetical protein [Sedimentisphaerales bacterium]
MARICLVSCVSQKAREPSKAKDLYVSPLFRKAKEYAEGRFDRWYILSAEYGLVSPDSTIAPYERTLNGMPRSDRLAWAQGVYSDLVRCTDPNDEITFLAGVKYREHLAAFLAKRGNPIRVPMEGMGIGKQLHWLTVQSRASFVKADLDHFYESLGKLDQSLGGKRILSQCNGKIDWPKRGVYFFFEESEFRAGRASQPRVVRVGTHMVSTGSKATFWHRLRTHRGTEDGRGNHRGSIFRLHVGKSLMARSNGKIRVPSWGEGQTASAATRKQEEDLERKVSQYLGKLPFLWLAIPDSAGPTSDRAYIERNSIGLLSNCLDPLDTPSDTWLGRYSSSEEIRGSGLWNVNHVRYNYDRRFLRILERYVDTENGKHAVPARSIAPRDWYSADKGRDVRDQMKLFDEGENE